MAQHRKRAHPKSGGTSQDAPPLCFLYSGLRVSDQVIERAEIAEAPRSGKLHAKVDAEHAEILGQQREHMAEIALPVAAGDGPEQNRRRA